MLLPSSEINIIIIKPHVIVHMHTVHQQNTKKNPVFIKAHAMQHFNKSIKFATELE